MADNIGVTPGIGAVVAADEIAGVLHQRVKMEIGGDGSASDVSSDNPMPVTGRTVLQAGSFNRPADILAYAVGDLVANNTVAGAVVAIQITAARAVDGSGRITRAHLTKSNANLANAQFRAHLYRSIPVIANGDNAPWLTTVSGYLGSFDITLDRAFSDGAKGIAAPNGGQFIAFKAIGSQTLYALIEARAAYAPASGESFTLTLEIDQD